MSISQRAPRFKEIGKLVSIKPSSGTPMTAFESYEITTTVQPANIMHARDPILKPGTETALEANAIFFEPVESYSADGVPQFKQFVINSDTTVTDSVNVTISTYKEFFNVVDPGIIGNSKLFLTSLGTNDGSAGTLVPKALAQPVNKRKEGTVTVTLTESNATSTEAAYKQVEWCSIQYATIFQELPSRATSVKGNYRTFSNFLAFNGTDSEPDNTYKATTSLDVSITGEVLNISEAKASGVSTIATSSATIPNSDYDRTGIYRSQTVPFLKRADGTQLYLKTDVTFA